MVSKLFCLYKPCSKGLHIHSLHFLLFSFSLLYCWCCRFHLHLLKFLLHFLHLHVLHYTWKLPLTY
ncbi:WSSV022 [White spot syndrome virus]|uniref:WSSV022 n=1 Tax=White spot syndrome virus TaxID=92652 RepID=Q8QTH4_WSSV|nr:WSSV022 [Shrimp white spot syndrome virus]